MGSDHLMHSMQDMFCLRIPIMKSCYWVLTVHPHQTGSLLLKSHWEGIFVQNIFWNLENYVIGTVCGDQYRAAGGLFLSDPLKDPGPAIVGRQSLVAHPCERPPLGFSKEAPFVPKLLRKIICSLVCSSCPVPVWQCKASINSSE